jgi:glycerol transport system ATP-binding protein
VARVELVGVSHRYGRDDWAIRDVNIVWEDGVASALLGPSGSGKTTVLGIISGLITPTEGKVLIDGVDVTEKSARERNVAQVFQFPVMYETLNVFDNLAFPLRNQKMPEAEVKQRVEQTAELMGLTDVIRRNANRLGAAEQQRVSLARGIVRSDVSAVLLDEPLTVIDPQAKWQLRRELKAMHARTGMTMIYVTHDQHEALTFADQVTIMNLGAIVQTGTPSDLHERPERPFVGYFIGSPGMNLLDAERADGGVRAGPFEIPISADLVDRLAEGALQVGIRPEYVKGATDEFDGATEMKVSDVDVTGHSLIAHLELGELRMKAVLSEDTPVRSGDTIWVDVPAEHANVYVDGVRLEVAP